MYKEDTPTISAHMMSYDVLRDNAVSYSEAEKVPLPTCKDFSGKLERNTSYALYHFLSK